MPKLLCSIAEVFHIEGRGTVAILEDQNTWRIPANEEVHVREAIRILRPDRSFIKTFIKSFDWLKKAATSSLAVGLPADVGVNDIPPASLVFLERDDENPLFWDGRRAEFTPPE